MAGDTNSSHDYSMRFATEAEADAFKEGLEFTDDDHLDVDEPIEEYAGLCAATDSSPDNNWVVRFRRYA